jgi:hypothetical protein
MRGGHPAEARAIARALLDLADTAERDGRPGASGQPAASRKEARRAQEGQ